MLQGIINASRWVYPTGYVAYPARGSVRSEQRSPRPKEPAGKCEVIFARPLSVNYFTLFSVNSVSSVANNAKCQMLKITSHRDHRDHRVTEEITIDKCKPYHFNLCELCVLCG